MAHGVVQRTAPGGAGLPLPSGEVAVRISKGIGTPGDWPDIVGIAVKIPAQGADGTPWDILLASTHGGRLFGRFLLTPTTTWSDVVVSTLMPLRYRQQVWWLRAVLRGPGVAGLDPQTIGSAIAAGGVYIELEQGAGSHDFAPLARIDLTPPRPDEHDLSFDPVRNTAAGVELTPDWLTGFRRAAYRRSRQGRGAGS